MKNVWLCATIAAVLSFAISCKDEAAREYVLVPGSSADKDTNWVQDAYLKASNADAGDYFGSSVAISGDVIVVGAYLEDSSQTTITNEDGTASDVNSAGDSGAAYVFKKSGARWVQDAYLKPANAGADDNFGYSVAISGDTIVAGAPGEDSTLNYITNEDGQATTNNTLPDSGAVYVFKKVGRDWVQDAYFKASNRDGDDMFGRVVAVDGGTIVVGTHYEASNADEITNVNNSASADDSLPLSGAAYVFMKDASGDWYQDAYLKPTNNVDTVNDFNFGSSVAVSGDTIVVGAVGERSNYTYIINYDDGASTDTSLSRAGAAYVFRRNDSGDWYQDAYLKASNANDFDHFGRVAIEGDTIAIGAFNMRDRHGTIINAAGHPSISESDLTGLGTGAVYVFRRGAAGDWYQDAYLKASNGDPGDYFGPVDISGTTIVVGANLEDGEGTGVTNADGTAEDGNLLPNSGAVYVFREDEAGNWYQDAYIKASNSGEENQFANLAVDGDTIVVGSFMEDNSHRGVINADGHPTAAESDSGSSNSGAAYVFTAK